jgi:hypothetical protein
MSLGEIWRYPMNQQPQLMLTEAVVSVAVTLDHPVATIQVGDELKILDAVESVEPRR